MRLGSVARVTIGLVVVGLLVGGGVIGWLHYRPRVVVKPTPVVLRRGNVGPYLYAIEPAGQAGKKVVQFDPSLPADDNVVIPALKAIAQAAQNVVLGDDAMPEVQSRDETNYITFEAPGKRIWFELFRNSSGKVGSVRVWVEPI